MAAQRACRNAGLSCALVDPAAVGAGSLRQYAFVIVSEPRVEGLPAMRGDVALRLSSYQHGGGRVVRTGNPDASELLSVLRELGRRPIVTGVLGASFARDTTGVVAGFLSLSNYSGADLSIEHAVISDPSGRRIVLPPFHISKHSAIVAPVDVHLRLIEAPDPAPGTPIVVPPAPRDRLQIRDDVGVAQSFRTVRPGSSEAYESDVYGDGSACTVLDNSLVRVIVSEAAGARAFAFVDEVTERNAFTTVGALRDDVAVEPPLSTTDRIAKYTHQFPAGMFNRPYSAAILGSGPHAVVRFAYDAPDVVPHGVEFSRVVTLEPGARAFTVDQAADFHGIAALDDQRAVSVASLAVGDTRAMTSQQVFSPLPSAFDAGTTMHVAGNALGLYDRTTHELATVAWRAGDVEDATILERQFSVVVRLTLVRDRTAHIRYGYDVADTSDAAGTLLRNADAAAQTPAPAEKGTPPPPRTL
jgi:hypothetical protein